MCDPSLVHIARREYVLNCNWKVFCDNYLVGCLVHTVHWPSKISLKRSVHNKPCLNSVQESVVASDAHRSFKYTEQTANYCYCITLCNVIAIGQPSHMQWHPWMINIVFVSRQDGGYHVPYAHPDLASNLDLSGYKNELHDTLSIQIAPVTSNSAAKPHAAPTSEQEPNQTAGSSNRDGMRSDTQHTGNIAGRLDRLTGAGGRDAGYAFVYPNLMINRYG